MKTRKTGLIIAIICITSILLSYGTIVSLFLNVSASEGENQYQILVIGDGNDQYFLDSLSLDESKFEVSSIIDSETIPTLASFDLVVLFDANLSSSKINTIETYIDTGGSIVLFMGPFLHNNPGRSRRAHQPSSRRCPDTSR